MTARLFYWVTAGIIAVSRAVAQTPYSLIGTPAQANGPTPWPPGADIGAKMGWIMDAWASGGSFHGAVLAARGGEIVLERAYGLADIELGVANSTRTRFPAPGLTMQFTAAGLGRLVDRGLVATNKPIGTYLPELTGAVGAIPVIEFVRFRSGLDQDLLAYTGQSRADRVAGFAELLKVVNRLDVLAPPGQVPRFSGGWLVSADYTVLGALIERVSGKSLEEFIIGEVFRPLGMNNSGFLSGGTLVEGLARSYQTIRGELLPIFPFDVSSVRPNGAAYTTVRDVFTFLQSVEQKNALGTNARTLMELSTSGRSPFGIVNSRETPADSAAPANRHERIGMNAWGAGGTLLMTHVLDADNQLIVLSNVYGASMVYDLQRRWTRLAMGLDAGLPSPDAKRAVWATLNSDGPDAAAALYAKLDKEGFSSSLPLIDEISHTVREARRRGDVRGAEASARFWAAVSPAGWAPRYELGEALLGAGKIAEAHDAFRLALERNVTDRRTRARIDSVLSQKR